jgi:Cu-Zn family superoxide dismutase
MKNLKFLFILFISVMLLSCSGSQKSETEETENTSEGQTDDMSADANEAMAELISTSESSVTGAVTFTAVDAQTVRIEIDVHGLTPGMHALHLHEMGDCSAGDASSAGGHWNPTGTVHGKRGEGEFHKGDISNLEADADGNVSWNSEITGWTIGGDPSSDILNKAVIIHSGEDDFTSQPAGNAGSRVACGVITQAAAL